MVAEILKNFHEIMQRATSDKAMPLMKLSAGPLLHCLLRAMSQPTAHGSCVRFQKSTLDFFELVKTMPYDAINLDVNDVD